MSRDFEIVESRRGRPTVNQNQTVHRPNVQTSKIVDAVADNFGQILNLASDIAEIERMKVQSAAVIKQMEETRKSLLAEAQAYAIKKNAETDSVVKRMQVVRDMMRDFYQNNNNDKLTGEEFSRIISGIISEMGRL